jgi:hypothetical protein
VAVRERVKPQRDKVRRETYRRNWWRFSEPISELRKAISGLSRYIACPAQGKRIMFSWVDLAVCPSNLTTVFAFDDDYAIGVLNSFAHQAWLAGGWSSLRQDLRYTPSTVFETFPWPDVDADQRAAIAKSSRQVIDVRDALCVQHQIGLTRLYNRFDEGAFTALQACHRALDRTVADAYGWSFAVISDSDETLRRLLARNLAIAAAELPYSGP